MSSDMVELMLRSELEIWWTDYIVWCIDWASMYSYESAPECIVWNLMKSHTAELLGSSLHHQLTDYKQAKFVPVGICRESVRAKDCASGQFTLKGEWGKNLHWNDGGIRWVWWCELWKEKNMLTVMPSGYCVEQNYVREMISGFGGRLINDLP